MEKLRETNSDIACCANTINHAHNHRVLSLFSGSLDTREAKKDSKKM